MTAYQYDTTGILVGSIELKLNPIATLLKKEPVYLIPDNTTLVVPGVDVPGKAQRFVDGAWEYVEDLRGKVIYNCKTKEKLTVTFLGSLPDGFTFREPRQFDVWRKGKWELDTEALMNFQKSQAVNTVQEMLDMEAKKYGFDNIHTAAVWSMSKSPKRKARADALIAWGDTVWDFAEAEWKKQATGNPTYTTIEEFITALPKPPVIA